MAKKIRCYELIKGKYIWMDREELDRFWKELDELVGNAKS